VQPRAKLGRWKEQLDRLFLVQPSALDAFAAHLAEARIAKPRPFALARASASLVRTEIIARSFSASAA
jgi:hypothetical protein